MTAPVPAGGTAADHAAAIRAQALEAGKPLGHLPGVPQHVCDKLVARGEAIDALLAALEAETRRADEAELMIGRMSTAANEMHDRLEAAERRLADCKEAFR